MVWVGLGGGEGKRTLRPGGGAFAADATLSAESASSRPTAAASSLALDMLRAADKQQVFIGRAEVKE